MTTRTITKKGCCGGADCQCGGAACGSECGPCTDSGFQRPRFFAGQLLTEEDLQLLTNYVTGKNRLHNKHFFGEGVVCGLEVNCHPCGEGKVIVKPGYALDCCGNDLVLECERELDINDMIRDLRARVQAGYDCGDPCDDPDAAGDQPERRYDLFLRYRENETDPVSPYATNEPCTTECEPTRVSEGVCFELDCPKDAPAPPDLFSKIKACIGDFVEAGKFLGDARFYGKQADFAKNSFAFIKAGEPVAYTEKDDALLSGSIQILGDYASAYAEQPPEKLEIASALDRYQAAASAISRGYLNDGNSENFQAASLVLNRVAPLLATHSANLESQRERDFAFITIESGRYWTDPNLDHVIRGTPAGIAYATGSDLNVLNSDQTVADLAGLREWLLCKLDNGCVTDCTLKAEVEALSIGGEGEGRADATLALASALTRYLQACICCALLPPCPTCEDPRVLLARLTVAGCEVTKICNLERTFVLTMVALRYWVPLMRELGNLLEKFCCTPLFKQKPTGDISPGRYDTPEYFNSYSQAAMPLTFDSQLSQTLSATGIPQDNVYAFGVATDTIIEMARDRGLETTIDNIRTPLPQLDLSTALTSETGRAAIQDSLAVALDPKREPALTLIQEARSGFEVDAVNVINAFGDEQVRGALRNELGTVISNSLETGLNQVEARISENLDDLVQEKIDAIQFPDPGLSAEDLAQTDTIKSISAEIEAVRGNLGSFVTEESLVQSQPVKDLKASLVELRGNIDGLLRADDLAEVEVVRTLNAAVDDLKANKPGYLTANSLAEAEAVRNLNASVDDLKANKAGYLTASDVAGVEAVSTLNAAVDDLKANKPGYLTANDLAEAEAVRNLNASVDDLKANKPGYLTAADLAESDALKRLDDSLASVSARAGAAEERLSGIETRVEETVTNAELNQVYGTIEEIQGSLGGFVKADDLASHPEIVSIRERLDAGLTSVETEDFEARVKKIVSASALTPQKLVRNKTITDLKKTIETLMEANEQMAERLARLEG